MNKAVAATARAVTLCIAVIVGCNTTAASAAGLSNDAFATAASSYVVRFADLDVSRIEGASTLYARLRQAARVVCEPLESRQMGLSLKYRACMDKAIADAVTSVDRPLLTQYHQLRTKGESADAVQLANAG
jgi:UrcA family protein